MVATASAMACHTEPGRVCPSAPAWWASACISVKQISSDPSSQKLLTRSARSSRPSNISASFGYRACIDGRAATERSQERSVANEGAAVTDVGPWSSVSSVNIGIGLY